MQTEQKKQVLSQEHSVIMSNRRKMSLTGVTEVVGFSDTLVELKTCMGGLIIKGKGLTINKLNTDTGELDVNGEITSIQYTASKKDGIFAGLFK
jgi:sporulation protein YabP